MSTVTLSDDNTPIDPDDELLVAYLDGELDRDDRTELENRLLEDDQLRRRLQQLQTGWDFLDDLPDPAPSTKLVESTLELAVSEIFAASPKPDSIWSRNRITITIASLCVVAALATGLVVAALNARSYRQQMNDLAIAEHFDAYNYGSDLELMRQLSANQDWIKMVEASLEIGDIQIEPIAELSQTPVSEREALIQSLPQENVDLLNAGWSKFERLNETSRDQMRRTAEAVAQQPDSEFLLKTMRTYAVWRNRLPPELRDAVEKSEVKDRRAAIDQAIEQTQNSISKRSSLKLDDNSIDWIYYVLQRVLEERIESGDQRTIDHLDRVARRFGDENAEHMTISAIVADRSRGGPGPGSGGGGGRFMGGWGEWPHPLKAEEIRTIREFLPQSALAILESVARSDSLKETTAIVMWAEEAARRKNPWKRENLSPLERYQRMDPQYRDVVDLLPREEMLRVLSPQDRRRPDDRMRRPPPR